MSERTGRGQLCESLKQIIKDRERFEAEATQVLKEFAMYYTGVEVTVEPIIMHSGYDLWTLEADICCNGVPIKHYPLADLALLDLNELMLRREIERQKATRRGGVSLGTR